ncbi:MAG: asparaginase [Bacteroidetes bacterium]|nr:asparaginase [Bacteroidota bacterium]
MNPILVTKTRGKVVENTHRGVVCLVNNKGDVIFSIGDVNQLSYTRSALKLFQVLPLIEANGQAQLGLLNEELAIMCGSHNGEETHVEAVLSILKKAGLTEAALQCGPQPPSHKPTRKQLENNGQKFSPLHNNCSGKHAGFLAMCVLMNWDTNSYLEPTHPLQKLILKVAAEMHEIPAENLHLGEDGCSAPIFATSVYHQALAYKNLVAPIAFSESRKLACQKVVELITAYPFMIAGSGRYCTELMENVDGVIGKTGADGVYSLAFTELKYGCNIKIEDGRMGSQNAIAQTIIKHLGLLNENSEKALVHHFSKPVTNWNRHEVGIETVNEKLFETLKALQA